MSNMIIGLILGVFISIMIVSGFFFIYGIILGLERTIITGAAIGAGEMISYSLIAFSISFIIVVLLVIKLKNKVKE
jgi:hypothetical protein